jgi:hypothetical protein
MQFLYISYMNLQDVSKKICEGGWVVEVAGSF